MRAYESVGEEHGLNWEHFPDDALMVLLSYLDVTTGVCLLQGTNRRWKERSDILAAKYPDLWRIWYDRLNYSRMKLVGADNQTGTGVWRALKTSRQHTKKLLGTSSSKLSNCFSLPNRCFSFVPVAPDDVPMTDEEDDDSFYFQDDPPPVSFDCDSFLLTGQGTEFVLINPFTMTVTVHDSILDQAVHSDEGMLEQAWKAASDRIVHQRTYIADAMSDDDDEEHLLAADAIHETLHRNHYVKHSTYQVAPKQTLVSLTDSVDLKLEDYFGPRQNAHRRPPVFAMEDDEEEEQEEYEMSYAGIDAKPVWKNGVCQGTMLALARIVTRVGSVDEQDDCCWEVVSWYKSREEDVYTNRKSCQFTGTFNAIDVCSHRQCVYQNPCADDSEWGNEGNIFSLWTGQRIIRVIPLVNETSGMSQNNSIAQWKCQSPVTTLVASPFDGNVVIVGTSAQTLEFYQPAITGATLQQLVSIPNSVAAAMKKHGRPIKDIHPSPVTEIFCAKDVPIERAGFWTLQHSSANGSTLVLWRSEVSEVSENKPAWEVSAIVDLPLSGERTPKILYDGHRLLVYGQDHIGMILLVYQVRSCHEDSATFACVPIGEQVSGGVLNVGSFATTRFANRVRHIGLGGMENLFFESLYMTANERFVVLNTKNGNLLSGASTPYREGLIVIDLGMPDDKDFL